jgi:hypothetical protein
VCAGCSAEVAAAVRERQAMHNRQELRNTISTKQRTASSETQGERHATRRFAACSEVTAVPHRPTTACVVCRRGLLGPRSRLTKKP